MTEARISKRERASRVKQKDTNTIPCHFDASCNAFKLLKSTFYHFLFMFHLCPLSVCMRLVARGLLCACVHLILELHVRWEPQGGN